MSRDPWIGRPYYSQHTPRDAWTRKALDKLDALAERIADWPPIIRNGVAHEIDSLRREAATYDGHGHSHGSPVNASKGRVTRLIEILTAELDRMIVAPDAEQTAEGLRAYDGSVGYQRAALLPLQRDIVCRAIRHEVDRLQRPAEPLADGEPSFLAHPGPAGDDDVEVVMLRHASRVLTPRTD